MSKSLLSGLALSVLLAGCATSQENPNYKISSKYKGVEATTQLASIQTSPTIQGANYGQYQTTSTQSSTPQTVNYQSAPSSQRIYQARVQTQARYIEDARIGEPTPSQPAPTDQQYAGQDMQGTPGYGLFVPEEVQYDYNQNVVTANSSIPYSANSQSDVRDFDQAPTLSVPTPMMSGNYVVKQGDTMYSLSRNLCVDLNTLALTNGIGNDFAIKIGQSLNLPASRC